jgi:predicted Fe-Mo cluster-binding NifX family protein
MSKRVAVSVKSTDGLDSLVDPRFGRAHAFLIVELETGEIAEQFFNNAASASQGSGTEAAVAMKANSVNAVISGAFGPKAFQALNALNVEMWTAPYGVTAREALDRLKAGSLQQMKVKVY